MPGITRQLVITAPATDITTNPYSPLVRAVMLTTNSTRLPSPYAHNTAVAIIKDVTEMIKQTRNHPGERDEGDSKPQKTQ